MAESKLTGYERKLVEEAISEYMGALSDKEDVLEELKDEIHVTQEIDELITDGRLKRQKLGEIIYKI